KYSISPDAVLALSASKRIMERLVTDFPEPDSPTIPKVSPVLIVKLKFFTATILLAPEPNSTLRSTTERIAFLSIFLILKPVTSFLEYRRFLSLRPDLRYHDDNLFQYMKLH